MSFLLFSFKGAYLVLRFDEIYEFEWLNNFKLTNVRKRITHKAAAQ